MDERNIVQHPVFQRLSRESLNVLLDAADLYEAPGGAVLYNTGDSGEDMIFLLEGQLESPGEAGTAEAVKWFPGDLVRHEFLVHPCPVRESIKTVGKSRWLSWSRENMLKLNNRYRKICKALKPFVDSKGVYLSGLPEELPSESGVTKSRRYRKSLRPVSVVLFLAACSALLMYILTLISPVLNSRAVILPSVLFGLWLFAFMVKYFSSYHVLEPDAINFRSFSWSHLAVESRYIPVDTVLGVDIHQESVINRILGTGTVVVRTSAIEGNIVLDKINHPQKISRKILEMRSAASERKQSRNQENMRRILEKDNPDRPRILRASGTVSGESSENKLEMGQTIFRKSIFLLLKKTALPVMLIVIPLLFYNYLAQTLQFFYFVPIPAFFWLLYRFEDWRNDKYLVSGGYAVALHRVPLGLKETRRQVELIAVQNIRMEQKNLLAVLLGFGDIVLVTTGGGADMVFQMVSRPWRVQQLLFQRREGIKSLEENRQRERENEEMIKMAQVLKDIQRQSTEVVTVTN